LATPTSAEAKTKVPSAGISAIIAPFLVWAAIAFAALAALGYVAVTHLNDLDRGAQRKLARTALMLERSRIATLASEYSWWDVANENLFPTPDPAWIKENIGEHVQSNLDIDLTIVVDRANRLHVAYLDEQPVTLDPTLIRRPDVQALIGKARSSPMDPIAAASGFTLFKGQLYVLGVSPFSPEIPPENASPDLERAVLIYGRRIDADFLATQATNFGFTDLRLTSLGEPSHKTVKSSTDVPLAGLIWKTRASGSDLIARLIVPAVAVLAVFGVLAWYFLRRAQAISQALVEASEITTRQNAQLRQSEAEAVRSQGLAEQASAEKEQALVTLRQRNRDLLSARHEAMEASQAKTMFLAAMSHELRTPLNAIIGFSEILKNQHFGPLGSDRYVDYADNIQTSGTHLMSLINDVLDIAKIEAGKLTLATTWVALDELCSGTLKLFQEQAHAGQVALSFTSTPPEISMRADPQALRQILVNLLSNALKSTRPGDEISVRATTEPVAGDEAEANPATSQVKIIVSDTGIGIAEAFRESIFLPFNRGGEYSGKESGTGLGLALVKSLTELHGGQVELQSAEGRGTTVTIILPQVAPEPDADC
jgi:signal transduction histidine kinase